MGRVQKLDPKSLREVYEGTLAETNGTNKFSFPYPF